MRGAFASTQALGAVLLASQLDAAILFVAPDGYPGSLGTVDHPYNLATALSGRVGQPGDTFWLREGNYVLGHSFPRIAGEPGKPVTFRSTPGEHARINGSF